MEETLLLADNDLEYLDTTKTQLEKAGYNVLTASTPEETRRMLAERNVDLVILDLRLRDNHDEYDVSGLEIAEESTITVPKVIVSEFGSFDAARKALGMRVDGLPAAVEFVRKGEGVEGLLRAIRKGLQLAPYFRRSLNEFSELLSGGVRDAYNEAKRYNALSLGASILGILVILVAGILGLQDRLAIAVATGIAGMIVEAAGYLAFRRSDAANTRRDQIHAELLKNHHFDVLLAACSTLDAKTGVRCRVSIIEAAINFWLTKGTDNPQKPLTTPPSE